MNIIKLLHRFPKLYTQDITVHKQRAPQLFSWPVILSKIVFMLDALDKNMALPKNVKSDRRKNAAALVQTLTTYFHEAINISFKTHLNQCNHLPALVRRINSGNSLPFRRACQLSFSCQHFHLPVFKRAFDSCSFPLPLKRSRQM